MGNEVRGPLTGLRVVELVGLGPGPYCGSLLSDLGADVVAVDRPAAVAAIDRSRPARSPMMRGKRGIALDLKTADGVASLIDLTEHADVLIDPFRPGVCERLGIGPDVLCAHNPRLIYGRMTGWGQTGPLADRAGHDINYIALSGALHSIGYGGDDSPPSIPVNYVGDFAGGGMLLALGIACAAFERSISGRGQVIDAAMVDGAAQVMGPMVAALTSGTWGPRGTNHLDGGAPWYGVYMTADGKWISIGSLEPQFYAELHERLAIDAPNQWDRDGWPAQKERLAAIFATKTRDDWCDVFEGSDACFAPVLHASELTVHPHTAHRGIAVDLNGSIQQEVAPRFSRTPAHARLPEHPGGHTAAEVLESWRSS